MHIHVRVRRPGEAEDRVTLPLAEIVIGSAATCAIRIAGAEPSHARIDPPGRWDTGSLVVVPDGETRVSGIPIARPTELTLEHVVAIAGCELSFDLEIVPPPPPKPPSRWNPRTWFAKKAPKYIIHRNPPAPRPPAAPPPPLAVPSERLPTGDAAEAGLLAAIAAEPQAPAPRMVYADWLEQRGLVGHAAFVREPHTAIDAPDGQLIAATTSGPWRAVVGHAKTTHGCSRRCHGVWRDLAATDEPCTRHCRACDQPVRFGHDRASIAAARDARMPCALDFAVDEHLASDWYTRRCPHCGAVVAPTAPSCGSCRG